MTEICIVHRPIKDEKSPWSKPTRHRFVTGHSGVLDTVTLKLGREDDPLYGIHRVTPHQVDIVSGAVHRGVLITHEKLQVLKPDGGVTDRFEIDGADGNLYRVYHASGKFRSY